MDPRIERIKNAADYLVGVLAGRQPEIGIVLGSGLGKLADQIEQPLVIPYKDIPGFPVSTAIGHKGNFIVGTLGGKTVIAVQGRIHYYEGYGMPSTSRPCATRRRTRNGTSSWWCASGAGQPILWNWIKIFRIT